MPIQLPLERLDFRLRFLKPARLPAYTGSTLRGCFGRGLRQTACALRRQSCGECLLRTSCVYSQIFETPTSLAPDHMTRYQRAPHPYLIEPPADKRCDYGAGDLLPFSMVLVGRALEQLPTMVQAWILAGERGLGRDGSRFELADVSCRGELIYRADEPCLHQLQGQAQAARESGAERLAISLLTPTRIVSQGRPLGDSLPFRALMSTLLRRISSLSVFHGAQKEEIDFSALLARAARVETVIEELSWRDWQRYSGRQKRKVPMGGLIGRVVYRGDLTPFTPYLRLGELVHVGKGTVMGMGRYQMEVEQ